MDTETIAKAAQKCIENNPIIVMGSGASIPHGIPGMHDLSAYLQQKVAPDDARDQEAWEKVQEELRRGSHLEQALSDVSLPSSLVEVILGHTWTFIAGHDKDVFMKSARGEEQYPLADLLYQLSRSTNMQLHIVTPNYDRLAEYAVDMSQMIHATGFGPGYIRRREGAERYSFRRGAHVQRTVRIWKVHGSLDWFEDPEGVPISLPITENLPDGLRPLIVTPGVSKYERTHDEPFRSVIQGADSALQDANSFICIGYGFRDSHIQPKLVERCRQMHVPIVILARTLTDEARQFIATGAGNNFLALECDGDGTKCYSSEAPEGFVIPGSSFWSLDRFNELAF